MTLLRSRALAVGALLLGAGGAVQAAEPVPPPLQESKQVLRQLQKEQGQVAPGGAGGLRGALPAINAPDLGGQGAEPPQPTPTARQRQLDEAAKKRRADRNWLVDGMLRLEGKDAKAEVPGGEEAEEELDPADPDFLLKTYLKEQQAEKESEKRRPRDAAHASTAADPMAPFLREWLSGSPVEKAALGELADKPAGRGDPLSAFPGEIAAVPMSGGDPGGRPGDGLLSAANPIPGTTERAAGNPFLAGLDFGGLAGAGQGPATLPAHASPPPPPSQIAPPSPVFTPPAETPQPARQTDRKPPPSPHKENEKFFPQQKKF